MIPLPTSLRPLLVGVLALLALSLPRLSFAQPLAWLLPGGGETWTAGTTHSVEWTGGLPGWSVNVRVIRLVPFQTADLVALGTTNDGFASWTIPANFPPGAYQLYVEEASVSAWAYSSTFTVQAAPACTPGCQLVAVAMPSFEPPAGACGPTQAQAAANAQAYSEQQLAGACPPGYALDSSTIVTDVTFLPIGTCLPGYSGAFVAEASSVACCCPLALPADGTSWGRVKSIYR